MALLGNLLVKDYREKVVVDNKVLRKQRYVNEQKQRLCTLFTCFFFLFLYISFLFSANL